MNLIDAAASWNPVVDDRPCHVRLPAQRSAAPARRRTATPAPRAPRPITLTLTAQQADELPLCTPRLLAQHDVQPGDRVSIDLSALRSVHLTGLPLLMTVLWRRVGPHGEVLLTGGSSGLQAQLRCLDLNPAVCRAAVYGATPSPARATPDPAPGTPAPAAAPAAAAVPRPSPLLPSQRQPQDPLREPDTGWDARLTLDGEVDLMVDLRMQAQFNDVLDQHDTRTLALDLSNVTDLSLGTLRLLLQADQRLRARRGRLRLLHANPRVQRLLASTRTSYLADEPPGPHPVDHTGA